MGGAMTSQRRKTTTTKHTKQQRCSDKPTKKQQHQRKLSGHLQHQIAWYLDLFRDFGKFEWIYSGVS